MSTSSIFNSPTNSTRRGVADEARHYAQTNWAAKLRRTSITVRMAVIFSAAFSVGFGIETFAIRTGLYKTAMHNKTERRIKLDEQVMEFQENMRKWQEEDMRIAAEKAQMLKK